MACWLSEDEDVRFKAGVALQDVNSRRAYRLLLKIVDTHADVWRREQACYLLSFARDVSLTGEFGRIFSDPGQPPAVRAQAAEGLAYVLGYSDRRTSIHRKAVEALLPGLQDPAVEVRFWTCFALGNLRARRTIANLQRLVDEDDEICPTWWHVRDEAADAISQIRGEPVQSRQRIPM